MPVDPNRERVAIRYTADDGLNYAVVTSRNRAAAVGAVGAAATDPPLPTKWKVRTINLLQELAGRDRTMQVPYPVSTGPVWEGGAVSLAVAPYGPLEITGRTGERRTQGAPGYNGVATPANERVSIRYRSENGSDYSLVTTRAHAAAVGAVDGSAFPAFPEVWTPRHYNLVSTSLAGRDQKLILAEPSPTAAAWLSNAAFIFTVGPAEFITTGRKDEDRPRAAPAYVP